VLFFQGSWSGLLERLWFVAPFLFGSPLPEGVSIMGKSPGKVPPAVLDKAVKQVKSTRTYVFESSQQADWDEVRSLLPVEHRWLSNDQLMRLACNRRKQGAYSTKAKKRDADRWSSVKKAVKDYGSGDSTLEEVVDLLKKLKPSAPATETATALRRK